MRSFLEWFDEEGFYVADAWDNEKGAMTGEGKLGLFQFQRDILEHVFTFDEQGRLPYTQVVFGQIKKSGKSTLGAAVAAWVAEEAKPKSEIYIIANDRDQAQERQYSDFRYHMEEKGLKTTKLFTELENGTMVRAIANQASSSEGGRHFLSLWDELHGFVSPQHQRMWAAMTPPPTVLNAFRLVTTYAGYENESNLLYDIYERGWLEGEPVPELAHIKTSRGDPVCRRKKRLFVMWDDVPRLPWQTEIYYSDQIEELLPMHFLRMHRNQWVTSSEAFIPIEKWDKCVVLDGQLQYKSDDYRKGYPITIGVDVAPKHDCSAAVGTYYDLKKDRPGLAFHKIWTPEKGVQFDLEETVEKFILEMWMELNVHAVLYDPMQMHRSATTLAKRGVPMVEFPQTTGPMTAASQTLYNLLMSQGIDIYADDELRDHIRFAPAKYSNRGFRIVKDKHAKYKVDAAVALVMSVYWTIKAGGMAIEPVLRYEVPFSDVSRMRSIPTVRDILEEKLPEALRS